MSCRKGVPKELVCKGKVERVPVEMVVDTGCSYTLVHSSLVPDAKFTQDQWVEVQCALGDVSEYPVAKVDIRNRWSCERSGSWSITKVTSKSANWERFDELVWD